MSADVAKTIWVCLSCSRTETRGDAEHESESPAPWSLVSAREVVARGLRDDEHECEDRWIGLRPLVGCGEEELDWSDEPCGGCGAADEGERYAFTRWLLT